MGEDGQRPEFLRWLTSPRSFQLNKLFSQARETPLELRRLVPILLEAVAQDDAESWEVRADRSPAARGLDGSTRSRLQGEARTILQALDIAASEIAVRGDALEDSDEADFFADPFANLLRHLDFGEMVTLLPSLQRGIEPLSVSERLYLLEALRQAQRPSILQAVLRSQFIVAVSLIQPALSEALLTVMLSGTEEPISPEERSALDHKVTRLLVRSPENWRRALFARFDPEILDRVVDWEGLTGHWAKRNLFAHRGFLADAPFREAFPDGPPIGAPVEVTEAEVLEAFDFAAATRLAFLVAAADLVTPSFGEQFALEHDQVAMQDLSAKRWWLAEGTARAALAFAGATSTRAVAQVNLWLARSGRLGLDAVRAEVEAWDGEAFGPTFGLARLILLGEDEAALAKIAELSAGEVLRREYLETWPLFAGLRDRHLLDGV